MSVERGDAPGICHVRTPINPRRVRGNSFYTVRLSGDEDGSHTFCGAAGGMDLSYAEVAQRRADFDHAGWLRQLPAGDAMAGMLMCGACLREAVKVKQQHADAKTRRKSAP